VIPPRKCSTRTRFYWLLLAAAYGLVNAKWQETSDSFLHSIGLTQIIYVSQLFYRKENNKPFITGVKVFDDILFAAPLLLLKETIQKISKQYNLGTNVYGPGTFKFFGLDSSLNAIEMSTYRSVNNSLGWIGVVAFLLNCLELSAAKDPHPCCPRSYHSGQHASIFEETGKHYSLQTTNQL